MTCLSPCRMLSDIRFPVLLLAILSGYTTGQPCQCSALQPAGLKVNCSFLNLTELPRLPTDTTELFVQDNLLTFVPPGWFDRLVGLQKVTLYGNPFHCDCRIQYLRNWLLKNRAIVAQEPNCTGPSSVANMAITQLSDDYFSVCATKSCTGWTLDTIIAVMLCCVIVLLLWSLRLVKLSNITLFIDERHLGLDAKLLHSLRPKHRRRHLSASSQISDSLTDPEDLEKPLLNMELLPQVLEVLHKKHDIRINLPGGPHNLHHRNNKHTAADTSWGSCAGHERTWCFFFLNCFWFFFLRQLQLECKTSVR